MALDGAESHDRAPKALGTGECMGGSALVALRGLHGENFPSPGTLRTGVIFPVNFHLCPGQARAYGSAPQRMTANRGI